MNISSNRDENNQNKKPMSEMYAIILFVVSILFCVTLITGGVIFGSFGDILVKFLLGVFGYAAYPIFIGTLISSVLILMKKKITMSRRHIVAFVMMFVTGIFSIHLFTTGSMYGDTTYGSYLSQCFLNPQQGFSKATGGGALIGLFVYPIAKFLSIVGAYIVVIGGFLISTLIACDNLFFKRRDRNKKMLVKEYREYPRDNPQQPQANSEQPQQYNMGQQYQNPQYQGGQYIQPQYIQPQYMQPQQQVPVMSAPVQPIVPEKKPGKLFVETLSSDYEFGLKSKKELKQDINPNLNTLYDANDSYAQSPHDTAFGKLYGNNNIPPVSLNIPNGDVSYVDNYEKQQTQNLLDNKAKIEYILKKPDITELYPGINNPVQYTSKPNAPNLDRPTMIVHKQYPNSGEEDYTNYYTPQKPSPMYEVKEKRVQYYPSQDNTSQIPPKIIVGGQRNQEQILREKNDSYNQKSSREEFRGRDRSEQEYKKQNDDFNPSRERYEHEKPPVYREIENKEPFKDPIDSSKVVDFPVFTANKVDDKKIEDFEQIAIDPEEFDEPVNVTFKPDTTPKNIDGTVRSLGLCRNISYNPPPIDLISQRFMDMDSMNDSFTQKGRILEEVLEEFGVSAKVDNIVKGPTVTRYELLMPRGVKVKKVLDIANDIAMRLEAAGNIRIEAPIPGKNLLGIEVPNNHKLMVGLREVIDSIEFKNMKSALTFAIGKDVAGNNVVSNICKMPHLLVAGATGMGKSICLTTLIISLLYKASPNDMKMILIDPKRVEFRDYNGLPHMLLPKAITEVDKAMSAINWAISEMERRYKLFENFGTKDFQSYHDRYDPQRDEKLPYIVIIMDEFNDFMIVSKGEIEERIVRLTQKSRAAGIHVVLATQRPTTDIVSGTIKNNLPARIALKVGSGTDSRTILDNIGAEDLLGNGDMLYLSSMSPVSKRLQGAYISENEVKDIVNYIKDNNEAYFDEQLEKNMLAVRSQSVGGASASGVSEEEDANKMDALRLIVMAKQASATFLQKKLSWGYPKASRVIDSLEDDGYITGPDGSKPRQVLITQEQFDELVKKRNGDEL